MSSSGLFFWSARCWPECVFLILWVLFLLSLQLYLSLPLTLPVLKPLGQHCSLSSFLHRFLNIFQLVTNAVNNLPTQRYNSFISSSVTSSQLSPSPWAALLAMSSTICTLQSVTQDQQANEYLPACMLLQSLSQFWVSPQALLDPGHIHLKA